MSAGGRFYLHILAALAEFERELISERTKAGMAAAKRNGKHAGRSGKETRRAIAARLGVDMATLRRALRDSGMDGPGPLRV